MYTGALDEYYDYQFGELEYRSLRFEHKRLEIPNYQGNAVVNYTEAEIPYTRIIEHKHFEFGKQPHTVITYEYPDEWHRGKEQYYPVNDEREYKAVQTISNISRRRTKHFVWGQVSRIQVL